MILKQGVLNMLNLPYYILRGSNYIEILYEITMLHLTVTLQVDSENDSFVVYLLSLNYFED